ncbi:hypothetical protein IVB30_20210 [Bradyrhizobium sp. 200]|uniref:hypothetical protein n=1 Tax=Bradyrhizobium sp. 200 TaxID=2782665 RepID=UPI001FFF83DC|nr:hypothetical protein [Bradyrhizobium sp. 200]UPJ53432.1 hypothetical protein IVB30_20210 [Bradyrhizobium sp. 200]
MVRLYLHIPAVTAAPDSLSPAYRSRLQQTSERAFRRAIAGLGELGSNVVILPPAGGPQAGTINRPLRGKDAVRERFDGDRVAPDDDYGVPSYNDEGRRKPVRVLRDFKAIEVRGGGAPAADLVVGDNDRIVRTAFPKSTVLRAQGNFYVFAGGSPYIVAANLSLAAQWGMQMFGKIGFAILQPDRGSSRGPFTVVGLLAPFSIKDLDGLGDDRGTRRPAELIRPAGHTTVMVATADGIWLFRRGAGQAWTEQQFLAELQGPPPQERVLDPSSVDLAAQFVTQGADTGHIAHLLSGMDTALFAAMTWEVRANYLELLLRNGLDNRSRAAVIRIIRATRRVGELEALFARLRARNMYTELFASLDSDVFELLQFLGEFRSGSALTPGYFFSVVAEIGGPIPGLSSTEPLRDLTRWALGFKSWLLGMWEGIVALFTHPGELLEGLEHLAEFLWIIQKAQLGDRDAINLVHRMIQQGGSAVAKAIDGLHYAEELGSPYGKRDRGHGIAGDILGRLKAMMVFEVLSWFLGIGEVKAAIGSLKLGDRIANLARLLGALRVIGGAARSTTEAQRLARVIAALAQFAKIAEDARIARALELLPESHIQALERIAGKVDLAEGAGHEALRLALRGDEALLRSADEIADALAVTGHLEAKAVGGVTPDMISGLHALLGHSGMNRAQLIELIEHVPAGRLDEFMHTMTFVGPENFERWGVKGLKQLTDRPGAMGLLREGGGDLIEAVSRRMDSGEKFQRFIDGLAYRRQQIGDPAAYQRLLDRLAQGEAAAFEEIANANLARRLDEAAQSGKLAELALARLQEGHHTALLEELNEIAAHQPALFRRRASELARLSDRELEGLEQIARLEEFTVDWADVLDGTSTWAAADRGELLGLIGDVAPHATEGMVDVLRGVFGIDAKSGVIMTKMQGSWGQLYAGRTLINRGARNLRFELTHGAAGLRREVDIVADIGGRTVHVEVKTDIGGVPSFEEGQIIKDLVTHAPNRYDDLLYLYHPSTQGQLGALGQQMLGLFDRPAVQQLFNRNGLNLQAARQDFVHWLASGRLTTYGM